jgi:hypothetical protein
MKKEDRIIELEARKLSREATEEELLELHELLEEDPQMRYALKLVETLWKLPEKEDDGHVANACEELMKRIKSDEADNGRQGYSENNEELTDHTEKKKKIQL